MKLSTNEHIDSVEIGDCTVELVAYIEKKYKLKHLKKDTEEYDILNFVISNGRGKSIHCSAWDVQARRLDKLPLKRVLHINGASCFRVRESTYEPENVGYELRFHDDTSVVELGMYDDIKDMKTTQWEVIGSNVGNIVKIEGRIKTNFTLRNNKSANFTYGLGAITNGREKIEIHIVEFRMSNRFKRGDFVAVIGEVKSRHETCYLKVTDLTKIKVISDGPSEPRMSCDDMAEVSRTVKRKRSSEPSN